MAGGNDAYFYGKGCSIQTSKFLSLEGIYYFVCGICYVEISFIVDPWFYHLLDVPMALGNKLEMDQMVHVVCNSAKLIVFFSLGGWFVDLHRDIYSNNHFITGCCLPCPMSTIEANAIRYVAGFQHYRDSFQAFLLFVLHFCLFVVPLSPYAFILTSLDTYAIVRA